MKIITPKFWLEYHMAYIHDHVEQLREDWRKQSVKEELWIYADLALLLLLLSVYMDR